MFELESDARVKHACVPNSDAYMIGSNSWCTFELSDWVKYIFSNRPLFSATISSMSCNRGGDLWGSDILRWLSKCRHFANFQNERVPAEIASTHKEANTNAPKQNHKHSFKGKQGGLLMTHVSPIWINCILNMWVRMQTKLGTHPLGTKMYKELRS